MPSPRIDLKLDLSNFLVRYRAGINENSTGVCLKGYTYVYENRKNVSCTLKIKLVAYFEYFIASVQTGSAAVNKVERTRGCANLTQIHISVSQLQLGWLKLVVSVITI